MTLKRIVIGTLGLVLAVVSSMALLYQRQNVDFLVASLAASSPVYEVKVSSIWSLLQLVVTGLLVASAAGASIAAMLRAHHAIRWLRTAAVLSAGLSLGTVMIYASVIAPSVARGGPLLPYGPRINYELLAALVALGLQGVLLALLRKPGNSDADGTVEPFATNDRDQMPTYDSASLVSKELASRSGTSWDTRGAGCRKSRSWRISRNSLEKNIRACLAYAAERERRTLGIPAA